MTNETSTMIQNPVPEFDPEAPITFTLEQTASRSALACVVAGFNPSHDNHVGRIKLLTAALITECEVLRRRPKLDEGKPEAPNAANIYYNEALNRAARWASLAITDYEKAAMWAVKSTTAIRKS